MRLDPDHRSSDILHPVALVSVSADLPLAALFTDEQTRPGSFELFVRRRADNALATILQLELEEPTDEVTGPWTNVPHDRTLGAPDSLNQGEWFLGYWQATEYVPWLQAGQQMARVPIVYAAHENVDTVLFHLYVHKRHSQSLVKICLDLESCGSSMPWSLADLTELLVESGPHGLQWQVYSLLQGGVTS